MNSDVQFCFGEMSVCIMCFLSCFQGSIIFVYLTEFHGVTEAKRGINEIVDVNL